MQIIGSLNSSIIAKVKKPLSAWFSLKVIPRLTLGDSIEPGMEVIDKDSVYQTIDGAADYLKEATIIATPQYPLDLPLITFESANPDIATIDENGVVTHVSDGTATIVAKAGDVLTRTIQVEVETRSIEDGLVWNRWTDNSLAKNASDAIDDRIEDKSSDNALKLFTTQDHNNKIYERNTEVWCADLVDKLTCISPWNSDGKNLKGGTLITPRHILFAAHFQINNNAVIRFIAPDNTVVERTMVRKMIHSNYVPFFPDIAIGVLDSDVPESIIPCKVAPANLSNYFPNITRGIPGLRLDQEEKATIGDLIILFVSAAFSSPQDEKRKEFYESIVTNDSGNPAFLIINDELVLLTVWTSGGGGGGTFIGNYINDINQMIAELDEAVNASTGYTVITPDLSTFPIF